MFSEAPSWVGSNMVGPGKTMGKPWENGGLMGFHGDLPSANFTVCELEHDPFEIVEILPLKNGDWIHSYDTWPKGIGHFSASNWDEFPSFPMIRGSLALEHPRMEGFSMFFYFEHAMCVYVA